MGSQFKNSAFTLALKSEVLRRLSENRKPAAEKLILLRFLHNIVQRILALHPYWGLCENSFQMSFSLNSGAICLKS